jgi:hypothetical protein
MSNKKLKFFTFLIKAGFFFKIPFCPLPAALHIFIMKKRGLAPIPLFGGRGSGCIKRMGPGAYSSSNIFFLFLFENEIMRWCETINDKRIN